MGDSREGEHGRRRKRGLAVWRREGIGSLETGVGELLRNRGGADLGEGRLRICGGGLADLRKIGGAALRGKSVGLGAAENVALEGRVGKQWGLYGA